MEQEAFFSGYCRGIDGSRMVTVVTENGALVEADCSYGSCPHEPTCPIAAAIAQRQQAPEQEGQ